jgi:hypothetical protein
VVQLTAAPQVSSNLNGRISKFGSLRGPRNEDFPSFQEHPRIPQPSELTNSQSLAALWDQRSRAMTNVLTESLYGGNARFSPDNPLNEETSATAKNIRGF